MWLLAGAALTLTAGAALADPPTDAQRQAKQDSASAAKSDAGSDRSERREMRIYRRGDGDVVYRGGRSDYLSDILQLRPEQEPALKAFLEATRRDGDHRDHMVKFERDSDRTTLQRLDDMQARLAEQQAETNRKIAAIKTFYGQLDAGQKKAFDAMPMLMFSGPSFGPQLIPVGHPMPPMPPRPPEPPRL
jgi:type I site-specific restriction endonuclease